MTKAVQHEKMVVSIYHPIKRNAPMGTPNTNAGSSQRLADMRVLLNEVRKSTEAQYHQIRTPLDTPKVFKWMRTLDSATLNEYHKALNDPVKLNEWGGPWGSVIEMFIKAGMNDLDDTQAALILFTSRIITPTMNSWAVRGGTATLPAFDISEEYVTGLYDMLRYRPDSLPDDVCEALLISNVYHAQPEARAALAALITVANNLVLADVSSSLTTNEHYDSQPPHVQYVSMNERGSVWIGDDELVQYVLAHPADAGLIAGVIMERQTGDVGTITTVLGHGVAAVSSGVL